MSNKADSLDLECSVCGINCLKCPFLAATEDVSIRKKLAKEFNSDNPDGFVCSGCRGPLDKHWSGGCKFLLCCHYEKKLHDCSQCDEFPCHELEQFGKRDSKTQTAYARLLALRNASAR